MMYLFQLFSFSFRIKPKIMFIVLVEQHEIEKRQERRTNVSPYHTSLFHEDLPSRYTFFTSDNAKQASNLIRVLQEAGQSINQELLAMAEDHG
jgi:hypothetical protein